MRRIALASLGYASLILAPVVLGQVGCSTTPAGENVIRAAEPIQGGTVDQTDTAVVGILINSSQGMSLCSGSLIGPNLVLSAHHCVADPPTNTNCAANGFSATYSASSFMVTTNYNAAATIFNGGGAFPKADNVTWWAVKSVAVPGGNICGQDMSALTLSSSIAGVCPLIPAVDTNVTTGEAYTAIGFGITTPNGQAAGERYKVTGMSVQCVSCGQTSSESDTQEWTGGASAQKGTCEGDSGGPAIDSTGRVIGSVSRGPQGACNQTIYESVYGEATWIKAQAAAAATAGGYAAAGWVTGAATSDPTSGYCGGTSSSSSSSTSTTSSTSGGTSTSSSGGSSSGCPSGTTCQDGDGMGDYGCFGSSGNFPTGAPKCSATISCATGSTCWATSSTATTGKCIEDCTTGTTSSSTSTGSTSTSSTSSSGGNQCAGQTPTGTPACDTCIDNSCCNEYVACSNDSTCVTCAGSATPPSSCSSDAAFTAFINCIGGTCGTACGASSGTGGSTTSGGTGGSTTSGGTGGSASSTSSGSSGTASGGTGGSSGTASGGVGGSGSGASGTTSGTGANRGTGANGGYPSNPGVSSGCAVAPTGSNAPASPTSLAGLLLGAALMFSRRKRA